MLFIHYKSLTLRHGWLFFVIMKKLTSLNFFEMCEFEENQICNLYEKIIEKNLLPPKT